MKDTSGCPTRKNLLVFAVAVLFFISIPAFAMDGNVLWLPFDGNFSDVSGNGLDGTANGDATTTSTDCQFGDCLILDGDGDYVEVLDNALLNFGTGDFSAEFWLKGVFDVSGTVPVSKVFYVEGYEGYRGWWSNNDEFYIVREDATTEDVVTCGGGYPCESTDGNWHHIVQVRRGNASEFWIDGNLNASSDFVIWNVDNNATLSIGAWDGTDNYVEGQIDELRLWNRSLSETEINNLIDYNSLEAIPEAPSETENPLGFAIVPLIFVVGMFLWIFREIRVGLTRESMIGIAVVTVIGLALISALSAML
jgi:hypothetical protein